MRRYSWRALVSGLASVALGGATVGLAVADRDGGVVGKEIASDPFGGPAPRSWNAIAEELDRLPAADKEAALVGSWERNQLARMGVLRYIATADAKSLPITVRLHRLLEDGLRSSDYHVRALALVAVKDRGGEEWRPTVLGMLADSNDYVRRQAVENIKYWPNAVKLLDEYARRGKRVTNSGNLGNSVDLAARYAKEMRH